MYTIRVQMLVQNVNSDWWKKIMNHFVRHGDEIEIHCWNEEKAEIKKAISFSYSIQTKNDFQTIIKGIVTSQMIEEFLTLSEPTDKTVYNKMTEFFTIIVGNKLFSEHYGTEVYLLNMEEDDVKIFKEIMNPYWKNFSISIE